MMLYGPANVVTLSLHRVESVVRASDKFDSFPRRILEETEMRYLLSSVIPTVFYILKR